jgi:POT family proton-dependent oligopeptide transporter
MCERFAYYGTTAVFVNFIQRDLPTSGPFPEAGAAGDGQPGALGMGQRASTGLVQFNAFFSYIMPLVGKCNVFPLATTILKPFTRRMGC